MWTLGSFNKFVAGGSLVAAIPGRWQRYTKQVEEMLLICERIKLPLDKITQRHTPLSLPGNLL